MLQSLPNALNDAGPICYAHTVALMSEIANQRNKLLLKTGQKGKRV